MGVSRKLSSATLKPDHQGDGKGYEACGEQNVSLVKEVGMNG